MLRTALTWSSTLLVMWSVPATAQSADGCKDVLVLAGHLDERTRSLDTMDMATASEFADEESSKRSEDYGFQYGPVSGSASKSQSNASAIHESQFTRLSRRQINESHISRGDVNAINAWERCKGQRRGPSATITANDNTNLELLLDWDQPNRIPATGARIIEALHISGATVTSGAPCTRIGYVIQAGGCIISLVRRDPGPVSVSVNTDFGAVSAYAPASKQIQFRRIPYPGGYPGTGIPPYSNGVASPPFPLATTAVIGHTGRDQGGSIRQDIVVVMNDKLVQSGWVFDISESMGAVAIGRGGVRGARGRCGQVSNIVAYPHKITASITVTTLRGDTAWYCDVGFSPGIVRAQ